MKTPLIADIKRNALDDGPGIRSTVFFKGCPLRCVWCHNPECIRAAPELLHRRERCIACGACAEHCRPGAIRNGAYEHLDREVCDLCADCVEECPAGALEVTGSAYSVDELVDSLMRDATFFESSGGGVTLSGGEPTLYLEYVSSVARALRERGVHVMIETCGDFEWSSFDALLRPHLDLIWIDLKLFDDEAHRRHCGRHNHRILDNVRHLARSGTTPFLVRVPLVPSITTTAENLDAIRRFLVELGITKVSLLPYNPLWVGKAESLGGTPEYRHGTWLTEDELARCRSAFAGLQLVGNELRAPENTPPRAQL